MSREVATEVEIRASVEQVWQILTDFDRFPQWNPFIRTIQGSPAPGTSLSVVIEPPGGSKMQFRPVVLKAEPGRELCWRGKFIMPGLFDGEHQFVIEPLGPGQVRFVHREVFSGLLVPLFWSNLSTKVRKGFEQMNAALKAEAERGGHDQSVSQ